MGTLFWLEYKRNLFSLPFFMSAVILAVVFITQCLPEEWRYYKEPMEKAGGRWVSRKQVLRRI